MDKPFTGTCESYYQNNQVQTSTDYVNGILYGEYASYYQDGSLKSNVSYENGFRRGFYDYYDTVPHRHITRFEFITPPKDTAEDYLDNYKFNGLTNRSWRYNKEHQHRGFEGSEFKSAVSKASEMYLIDTIENGIKFRFHFNNEYEEYDTNFQYFDIILGDIDNLKSEYDTIRNEKLDSTHTYKYYFSKKDISRGSLKGLIIGTTFYSNRNKEGKFDYPISGSGRRLYFRWDIEEKKLKNF